MPTALPETPAARSPLPVILDTDMLTDCDDAGALAMLHALMDRGEADLLGVVVNGVDTHGLHSAVVSAINTHYGRGDLPIGVTRLGPDATPAKPSSYSPAIHAEFPHDGRRDADRPDAVALYRELLAAAPDASVTILSIGFLSNLAGLLATPDGPALVRAKVREASIMGGAYPSGGEYNFNFANTASATCAFFARWPAEVPLVFTGFELGEKVVTGRGYKDAPPSPMRRAYELAYDSLNRGRPSWDQIAVLYGVRGLSGHPATGQGEGQGRGSTAAGTGSGLGAGTAPAPGPLFRAVTGGRVQVAADGTNAWHTDRIARHAWLEAAAPVEEIAAVVEALMLSVGQAH